MCQHSRFCSLVGADGEASLVFVLTVSLEFAVHIARRAFQLQSHAGSGGGGHQHIFVIFFVNGELVCAHPLSCR